MKASLEVFVKVTPIEAVKEAFVEAPVKVTSVEVFIPFIPPWKLPPKLQ